MRYRIVLIGVIGIALMVFAFSYVVYGLLFKKKLKNKTWNVIMVIVFILGGALLYSPARQYIDSKENRQTTTSHVVEYNGKKIKTEANAKERLTLPSVYGSIDATHPSVISFEEPWHGYRYWMAVTPYPEGKALYENPHVFKSNDLISWVPDESNPLDEPVSEKFNKNGTPMQYDSDTHIIYNKEDKRLEVFWRYVDDVSHEFIIYRRTSSNGEDWTKKEEIYRADRRKEDMLSPAFIKDEDGYKLWYVADGYRIWYRESKDGFNWSKPTEVEVPYEVEGMKHWHLDVQPTDLGYEMVVVGFKSTAENNLSDRHVMNLYYSKSKDNKNWDTLQPIIFPTQNKEGFDGKGLYRSALLKEDGNYYVFYSGIGYDETRGVSIATGKDIMNLKGMDFTNYKNLIKD
ncbi:hypothetical protein [Vagococcus jeotgali]|uniref:hypothetical protein n=1 Tax=Vagococcus jeotgali TaxID=3109030 RepID=UPI002DDA4B18|nr:hypothetical protein [Vagococcus sp. B2T-5]